LTAGPAGPTLKPGETQGFSPGTFSCRRASNPLQGDSLVARSAKGLLGETGATAGDEPTGDGELVVRAAAGDAEAFRGLLERHQTRIVSFLHRLCGCPEQALDLAQETFLAAWRHLDTFRQESRFSTWLHAIAVNQARAAGRRRRPVAVLDAVTAAGGRLVAEPVAAGPAVSAGLEQEDLARRLAAALDRLDDRYREVVVLADMQDCSYEEIAAALSIPVGTVRSRLHRGRMELRTLLAEP
jgi:RNA polymerase sigma-70 factor, ECF subfamily